MIGELGNEVMYIGESGGKSVSGNNWIKEYLDQGHLYKEAYGREFNMLVNTYTELNVSENFEKVLLLNLSDKYKKIFIISRKNFTAQDIRFTIANGYLYAIVLKYSESGDYLITSLDIQDASSQDHFSGIIKDVCVLGCGEVPCWERQKDGLHIHTNYRDGNNPIVFKITID